MKKSIILLSAAALVMFAACQKEEVAVSNLALTASLEQQAGQTAAKSTLDGTTVKWVAGDAIKVFDHAGKGAKFIAQSAGTSSTFSEPSPAEREADFDEANLAYAIYPYTSAVSCTGNEITFTLPATQTYAENSFGQDANVAVGVVNGTDIAFKNVCGVLKLQLKGNFEVSRIEVTGSNGEQLSGEMSTTVSATPVLDRKTTGITAAEQMVTLDCGEGVQLNPETATAFDIVVPTGAFPNGFTATIYDVVGDEYYAEISTTLAENVIKRSVVRSMPTIGANRIRGLGYSEVEFLRGYREITDNVTTGGAYFKTGIESGTNVGMKTKFAIDNSKSGTISGIYYRPGGYWGIDYADDHGCCPYWNGYLSAQGFNIGTSSPVIVSLNYKNDKSFCSSTGHTIALEAAPSVFGEIYCFGLHDLAEDKCIQYCRDIHKIYYCVYSKNDDIISYLIAARYKTGEDAPIYGMYDLKRNIFFTNEGDGAFTPGVVIE